MAKTQGSKRQQVDEEHDSASSSKRIRKTSKKSLDSLIDGDEIEIDDENSTHTIAADAIPSQSGSRERRDALQLVDSDNVDDLPSTSMLRGKGSNQNTVTSSSDSLWELIESILADRSDQYFSEISANDRKLYFHSSSSSKHKSTRRSIECYMSTLNSGKKQKIVPETGHTLTELTGDDSKEGSLINAGGYIYSVDWLDTIESTSTQYLAISASLDSDANTIIGDKNTSGQVDSTIQIWSINQKLESKLEIKICSHRGRISALQWVPFTSSDYLKRKSILGVIAACMQDGSVSLIPVPTRATIKAYIKSASDDSVVYLHIDSLIELDVKKGLPLSIEWSHQRDTLAVGYSDGWLATWNIASCLRLGSRKARPLLFYKIASSPISSLAWHPSGREIFVASYDGVTRCVQVMQPHLSVLINHSRDVTYAVAYCKATETLVMERPELDDVRSVIFIEGKVQSTQSYSHLGRVRVLSTSPHHSFIASGGVDGSVKVADSRLVMQKSRKAPAQKKKNIVSIIYRLDLHRGNSSIRMLDGLANVPPVYQNRHAMAASAAWDSSISISALRWNQNKSNRRWLASGTACGLVRVDVV